MAQRARLEEEVPRAPVGATQLCAWAGSAGGWGRGELAGGSHLKQGSGCCLSPGRPLRASPALADVARCASRLQRARTSGPSPHAPPSEQRGASAGLSRRGAGRAPACRALGHEPCGFWVEPVRPDFSWGPG